LKNLKEKAESPINLEKENQSRIRFKKKELITNKKKLEKMIEDLIYKKEMSILKNSQESTFKKKDKDSLLLQ